MATNGKAGGKNAAKSAKHPAPSSPPTAAQKSKTLAAMVALRAVKGGEAAKPPVTKTPSANTPAAKPTNKPTNKPAAKSATRSVAPASDRTPDDQPVIALDLPMAPLSPAMAAYFKKCEERLGFVPNVLKAYAFDMTKLEAFVAFYNDLMLGPSGLSKLEREMIAVAVSSQNRCYYCLTAHGAAVRTLGDPLLGEWMVMNYRTARLDKRQRAMLDFALKLTTQPWAVEDADRERLRRAGFSERDIWDVAAVTGFFNMSNRVASATDMQPNAEYHAQAR